MERSFSLWITPLDTPNLQTFLTVAALGSVSLAAERLHLTQPAVSKRLKLLEAQLQARLFDRVGRRLQLTEAGKCLLPFATRILRTQAEGRQALADLERDVAGVLQLAASHHIGLYRLPPVLRRYRLRYPRVRFALRFLDSAAAQEAVAAGEADLGLSTEDLQADARVLSHPVWEDPLHFVAASEHPLCRVKPLDLSDLAACPAILPDAKFLTARKVIDLFAERGLPLRLEEGLRTNNLETIKALLGIGDNWSVLPESMLADAPTLSSLRLPGIRLSRRLVCLRHRDRSLSRAAEAFVRLLDEPV